MISPFRSILLLTGLAMASAYSANSNAAQPESQATIQHFDLPPQNLAAGLVEFALQAHTSVIVEESLVANFESQPVTGRLDVATALTQLLSKTPLSFIYQPDTHAYLIQRATPVAAAPVAPTPSAPTSTAAIEEVVVTAYLTYPFRYTTVSNSHQQSNVPYFDSVRFANVLPQQLIADQQTDDFAEVLKYASGVMPGDGLADTNDDLYMRGFHRNGIFIDGFRVDDTTGIKLMAANIEQVEILKGPGTVLFGQAEPGGTLNFLRKKPKDTSFVQGEAALGTIGKSKLTLDTNYHFNSVNSRIIIAEQKQDAAGDVSNIHRQLVNPSISWQITELSQLDINYHWQRNEQESNPNSQTLVSSASIDNYYQDYPGRSPEFTTQLDLVTAHYNYDFSDNWSLGFDGGDLKEHRTGVRTSSDTLTNSDVLLKGQAVADTIIVMPLGGRIAVPLNVNANSAQKSFVVGSIRSLYGETGSESAQQATAHLNGTAQTGAFEHKLLIGADWRRADLIKRYISEVNDFYFGREWKLSELDTVMQSLAEKLFAVERPLGQLQKQESDLVTQDKDLYFSDSITLNKNWIASLGARHSDIRGEITYLKPTSFSATQEPALQDTAISSGDHYTLPHYQNDAWQFGLVYKPSAVNSWYFNYSEAVRANYRVDAPAAINARPETADQFELGLKSLLLDGRFLSSVGVYKISKNNISAVKPLPGKLNTLSFYDQSVQGIDLDLTWQLSPKLDLMAGGALLSPIIDSGPNKGDKPADIANQSASLFVHYRLTPKWSSDLGLSYLGARRSSTLGDKLATLGQEVTLPEYVTLDMHLNYQNKIAGHPIELKLSVKNATDEHYYTAFVAGVRPNIADERSILGTLRFTY